MFPYSLQVSVTLHLWCARDKLLLPPLNAYNHLQLLQLVDLRCPLIWKYQYIWKSERSEGQVCGQKISKPREVKHCNSWLIPMYQLLIEWTLTLKKDTRTENDCRPQDLFWDYCDPSVSFHGASKILQQSNSRRFSQSALLCISSKLVTSMQSPTSMVFIQCT